MFKGAWPQGDLIFFRGSIGNFWWVGLDQTCELDFHFSGLIGKTPDLSGDLGFDSRLKFNLST